MERRKIFLVILFLTVVIVFAALLYIFFFKRLLPGDGPSVNGSTFGNVPGLVNGNISVVNGNNRNQAQLPNSNKPIIDLDAPTDVARGGLTKVVDYGDKKIKGFAAGTGGAQFYDPESGLFLKLVNGEFTPLTEKKFFNVDSVTWSRSLDKAVIEYPDGKNIIYDFAAQKQITLPEELSEFSFDAAGQSIGAKWESSDRDENWLMVGDTKGGNFQLIEPLGDNADDVQVSYSPDSRVVGLFRDADSATTQVVLPLGTRGETFKQFQVEGLNFESSWSPAGNALLYSVADPQDNFKPRLWLTEGDTQTLGSNKTDLTLSTWPWKCAFNKQGSSVYCAEPSQVPNGSGLYPELAQGRPDVFYRIDINTGQKIPLALPVGAQAAYSAASVYLSDDESTLYFVDGVTQRLHSIRLQ